MKQRLNVFGRLALLWMGFFIVCRIVFMVYQWPFTASLKLVDVLMPNLLGLRMDAAMTGYWLILPGLALAASFFFNRAVKWVIVIAFYGSAIATSAIVMADLELYRHWGFRMDTTPLLYTGSEGLGSISVGRLLFLVGLFVMATFTLHLFFRRLILPLLNFKPGDWKHALVMFGCVALLFIPIRSSFRVAPLNSGVVFYHKTNPYPNHAGINVVWNFLKSVVSDNSFRYPTNLVDEQIANSTFQEMMASSDSTVRIINTHKPNILLIILEGFTTKVIEPLGGMPGITPHLNEFCNEGVLFDDFYASGDRTDKGLISILSGYPAQPKTSIIKYPNKTQSLPSLPRTLTSLGYHTSFVYGGDIGFANMESYLNIVGFQHITEDNDFDVALNVSKWGVHDEFVFARLLKEADTARAPFFKTMLSLSSHEPFDVPSGLPEKKDEESLFLNSCTYTDKCLGNFISDARQKAWWKNTLIIITADHGHRSPGKSPNHVRERFKIPMLWIGGAVDSARLVHKTGSQIDLVNTLLGQLASTNKDFSFSKNLLTDGPLPFAVYAFNNGFGYLSPNSEFVYDFDLKNYVIQKNASEHDLVRGRSFVQQLFKDYNSR